jgi:Tfp pilus assembly protein PilF
MAKRKQQDELDFVHEQGIRYEHLEVIPLELIQLPQISDYEGEVAQGLGKAEELLRKADIDGAQSAYEDLYKANKKDPQIANMLAALLLRQKDFSGAQAILKPLLRRHSNDIVALCNMASCALNQFDYSKNTEKTIMRALEKAPNIAEIHHNAGVFYHRQGRIEEALKGYKNAKLIRPISETLCGIGMLCVQTNQHEQAEKIFKEALALSPANAQAYLSLAELEMLKTPKAHHEALLYAARAVIHAPTNLRALSYFTFIASNVGKIVSFPSDVVQATHAVLEYDGIMHRYLQQFWFRLMQTDLGPAELLQVAYGPNKEITKKQWPSLEEKVEREIFWLGVKRFRITNFYFENALTALRRFILMNYSQLSTLPEKFLFALSENCFFNEYVFNEVDEETQQLERLEEEVFKAETPHCLIALLGCYRQLSRTSVAEYALSIEKKVDKPHYSELIKYQIKDPNAEHKIKKSISTIGSIVNDTSQAVKGQYEENPYPRWRNDFSLENSDSLLRQKIEKSHDGLLS